MVKKVYLMIKIRVPVESVGEFNEFWRREALPIWIKHGIKHIGSFTNFIGDPMNEIIRLFEFDSIDQWEQWERFLIESEEGQNLFKGVSHFMLSTEKKLLLPAYEKESDLP